ncbi:TadE/TadG family type IV pilus assembly protein [Pyxidicoccus xibeiensis]|uniref:TadE/TadG family type IV pilus assembly protein n=1 Tax=Pyxidicoccus xibeiensis TaxID=2906759 RepID=UPI0020A713D4|nr:pilus assembly protein TadG-related protein [Pyxidicoccus xibeiensis]MCP3145308.1 Tad domain-containing protein [Pyxidicoccus xibeiensis]
MFTRTLRQSFRRQEGQALVLAALMVLVMSIAVLTTVNIGHTVHERVRLQNTADAAAYSMAAMEARAFNFYAYANRTQVSHYVSAMMWLSLISLIYSAEAFFTDLYAFMKTLNPCAGSGSNLFWKAACPILENLIPVVSQIIRAVGAIMDAYKNFFLRPLQQLLRGLNPDLPIGRWLIPAHRVLNGVMYFASQAVMMSASTHVTQTTQGVIDANDKNISSLTSQLATGLYSQCLFSQAHSPHSGGKPLDPRTWKNPFGALDVTKKAADDPVARAKRSMGGITNATRYSCDASGGICPERFTTARRLGDLLPLPDSLGIIRDLLNGGINAPGILEFQKLGQTRMLSASFPTAQQVIGSRSFIRDWNDNLHPWGMTAQGDNMGADDLYWLKLGPAEIDVVVGKADNPLSCNEDDDYAKCFGDNRKGLNDRRGIKLPYRHTMKTSVWAMNDTDSGRNSGGVHWRVNYPDNRERWNHHRQPGGPERQVGVHRSTVCVLELAFKCWARVDVYAAHVRPVQDGNHPWGGVVPFMHFEPGQLGDTCNPVATADMQQNASRKVDFNQPTTWVALNKTPDQVVNRANTDGTGTNAPALLNDEGKVKFAFTNDTDELNLKNDRKKFLGLVEGLNVISRGQTYYHRPGNWTEQPNFFNPYWRPRLASVYQGRESLPMVNQLMRRLPAQMQGIAPKIVTH